MVLKGNPTGPYGPDHPRRIAEASMAVFPITNFPDPSYTAVPVSIPVPIVSGVVADPEELLTLGPAWDAITQRFLSPMQQSDWLLSCMHAFPHRGTPHMLVDAVDGKLCGVAPLIIDRLTWPPRATQLGVADLHEPTELVFADQASLDRLVERLADLRMPLRLERMPKDSPSIEALRRAFAGHGLVIERSRSTFPFITLSQAWEDPPGQLSARRRGDLRRSWKRAAAFGEITCDVLAPGPANSTSCSTRRCRSKHGAGRERPRRRSCTIRSAWPSTAITSAPPAIVERFACAGCDSATRPWPCSLPLKRPGGFGC